MRSQRLAHRARRRSTWSALKERQQRRALPPLPLPLLLLLLRMQEQ
jgi:hypothetical protein